jgi:mono/diheme cytochrome c family protein
MHARIFVLSVLASVPAQAAPVDFASDIKPLLEKSCIQCHGPEKQKGGLRLDTREALLKGSENGPVLAERKPAESELFKRAALPADHEDVMPPKGKAEHLTAAELDALKRWIAEGTAWPVGVVAVAAKSDAATAGPVATADEIAARAELVKFGVRVQPIAAGLNWTTVSFRKLGHDMPREAIAPLARLTTLVELDLGSTSIDDASLAAVAHLTNVATLNLSGTAIGDAALDHLTALTKLRTLNLFGTGITDAGLAKLAALKSLKRIYAAETKATAAGATTLREKLPQVTIDLGAQFAELARKSETPAPAKPVAPAK